MFFYEDLTFGIKIMIKDKNKSILNSPEYWNICNLNGKNLANSYVYYDLFMLNLPI